MAALTTTAVQRFLHVALVEESVMVTATVKEIFTAVTTIVETFMSLHHQIVHVALVSTVALMMYVN